MKESFLEDINNLLNSGEVPNLFEADDMEHILNKVRPLAKAAGKPEGRDAIYAHFVSLVRDNLHIVLCMSPVGDAFRVRCRMFPSLVNCCTIDWYDEWPEVRCCGAVVVVAVAVTPSPCRPQGALLFLFGFLYLFRTLCSRSPSE